MSLLAFIALLVFNLIFNRMGLFIFLDELKVCIIIVRM